VSLSAVLVGAVLAGGASLVSRLSTDPNSAAHIAEVRPDVLSLQSSQATTVPGGPSGHLVPPGGSVSPRPPTTTSGIPPTTTTTTSVPTTTTAVTTTTRQPPVTTTTTQPVPPPSQTQTVIQLVNAARADAGCKALTEDSRLDRAAQDHSDDMGGGHYFSHTTPAGVTFDKREEAAGYPSPGGENIAMGQRSAQQVMKDWMNSSGHRANILNCDFVAIGVGLDTNGWYWTQDFGR
jgi:uncharacterized protein YkwD